MDANLNDASKATQRERQLLAKERKVTMRKHLLIKVRSEGGKTIADHQRCMRLNGSVIFGKMGSPIGADFIADLRNQLNIDIPTYLFLALKKGWKGGFTLYKARLASVQTELSSESLQLVPEYYRHEHKSIQTWLEIYSLDALPHAESVKVIVLSSGREVLSVLSNSASVFCVGVTEVSH